MAGTAPAVFQFTKTLDAGPVHCSVWLSTARWPVEFASTITLQRLN